ncbi:MAG: hypothetical protein AB1746_08310, partial [Candidatus Zixiibacteriota bacterium]
MTDRPFQNLLRLTSESKKLLIFLFIFIVLGVAGIYYGVTMQTQITWLPLLFQTFGSTFLLASLIGIVYELGMRKTTLREMEKIVRDNIPDEEKILELFATVKNIENKSSLLIRLNELNKVINILGIQNIYNNRSGMEPFLTAILKTALDKLKSNQKVIIDLSGFGLTSFFDHLGLYYNHILAIANNIENQQENGTSRLRVIFPHPESIAIVERANAQVRGRPTVGRPHPSEADSRAYIKNIIMPPAKNDKKQIESMIKDIRLYTDIFRLGADFFKDRTISECKEDTGGIDVRFTRLNPAYQYIRIDNYLLIESYHY